MKYKRKVRDNIVFYFSQRRHLKSFYIPEIGLLRPSHQFSINQKLIDGVRAFWILDSTGELFPTKHRRILSSILGGKEYVNMMLDMYSEECLPNNQGAIHIKDLFISLRELKWPLWTRIALSKLYKKKRLTFYSNL